jgi:hypothetical protein
MPEYPELRFTLPDGAEVRTLVRTLLNAGYTGRDQAGVAAHIAELAELGVPAPETTPALYPVAPYLASQTDEVPVQHGGTAGEAEWALVITGPAEDDVLLTAACDHTDRLLEVHGVAWSKNAGPDVLARKAWRLTDVEDRLDELTLRAWVGEDIEIQNGKLADLRCTRASTSSPTRGALNLATRRPATRSNSLTGSADCRNRSTDATKVRRN